MRKDNSHRLEDFFKAENQRLSAYIQSKIDSINESEDLLQDVYLQLLGNLNVLDSIDNLAGWVYTVVKNKITDRYRRRKHKTISIDSPLDNGLLFRDVLAEELPDFPNETDPEEIVALIMESVEILPEKQKFVFKEQVMNGKTFQELADETGESINTLIARKRYAVSFLRKQLSLKTINL